MRPTSFRQISPVLSLTLFRDGVVYPVNELTDPVVLEFSFNSNIPQVNALLEDVFERRTRSK